MGFWIKIDIEKGGVAVELHHGTVTATSEPQVKTTFTVRLPYNTREE